MTPTPRALFLAALAMPLALAAQAQETPDTAAISGAVIACLTVGQDPMGLEMVLGKSWGRQDDTEQGLANFQAPQDETVFAFAALDGRFCHAESLALSTSAMADVVAKALTDLALTATPGPKDDSGCDTQLLSNGWQISVTSGGQDPVCSDDKSSAMRVTYKPN